MEFQDLCVGRADHGFVAVIGVAGTDGHGVARDVGGRFVGAAAFAAVEVLGRFSPGVEEGGAGGVELRAQALAPDGRDGIGAGFKCGPKIHI